MADIFQAISRLFGGQAQEGTPEAKPAGGGDVYQNNNDDIKLVLKQLHGMFGSGDNLGEKDLVFLAEEPQDLYRLRGNAFQEELRQRLSNSLGVCFKTIRVEKLSANETEKISLRAGLYIKIVDPQPQLPIEVRAVVKAMADAGSLLENEYVLDKEGTYNIGIGSRPTLKSGSIRFNHIAISDDTSDAQFEHNKYVSRAHAHIERSHTDGFLLYAEINGTSLMGKRTRILRGTQIIDLTNPQVPCRLQDGDVIELSKNVLLSFNIV